MTEAEWLACEDPPTLLRSLRYSDSPRKLRLFAVACCKIVWAESIDERSRRAINAAERHADVALDRGELESGRRGAVDAFNDEITPECYDAGEPQTSQCAAAWAASLALYPVAQEVTGRIAFLAANTAKLASNADPDAAFESACIQQCVLIRDIFCNPDCPVAFSPEWRTDTAVTLARQMYESRDFSAMPILADALQDAGCDSDDILTHCRDASGLLGEPPTGSPKPPPATHVRGCWVVDLVLGKE